MELSLFNVQDLDLLRQWLHGFGGTLVASTEGNAVGPCYEDDDQTRVFEFIKTLLPIPIFQSLD